MIFDRLARLDLVLPLVNPPKGNYVPAVPSGNLVHAAGQVPMIDGEVVATGLVGREVDLDEATRLSRQCALSALAAVDAAVGLDRVVQVVRVVGYVASAPGFTDQDAVLDGASELFALIFGPAGRHARSAVGVPVLPLNAPVEVEVTVEFAR